MKQIVEQKTFETFGDENLSHKGFNIKQSGAAFKILSSGLYSDKVLAVIRELSANAWDAHRMAGKENVPFEVHLPNTFEPFFYVKDFGIGLSHEDITNLYTTYFESTKGGENNSTGCFGLGSKSPFSYTDQFTVTSMFNGTKRVYTCAVNAEGLPSVSLLSTKVVKDASNGLEIRFAVDSKDFNEFKEKAITIYQYYETLPTIVGNPCTLPDVEYSLNSATREGSVLFKLKHEPTRWKSSKAVVVQGACSYPVETDNVFPDDRYSDVATIYRTPFVITVPIGTLNITASREQIEYDKPTIKALQKIAEDIVDVVKQEVEAEVKQATSAWQASSIANRYKEQHRDIFNMVKTSFIAYDQADLQSLSLKMFQVPLKEKVYTDPLDATTYTSKTRAVVRKTTRREANNYKRFTMHRISGLNLQSTGEKIAFVLDLDGTKQFNKVLEYNLLNKDDSLLANTDTLYFVQFEQGYKKHVVRELKKTFGGALFIDFSALEEAPKTTVQVSSQTKKVKAATTATLNYTDGGYGKKSVDKIMEHGGLYVETFGCNYFGFQHFYSCTDFIKKAKELNLLPQSAPVYFVGAVNKKALDKNKDKWTHIIDFIEDILEKKTKGNKKLVQAVKLDAQKKTVSERWSDIKVLKEFRDKVPSFTKLIDLCATINGASYADTHLKVAQFATVVKEARQSLNKKLSLTDKPEQGTIGTTPPVTNKGCQKIDKMFEEVNNKYPLLFQFGNDIRYGYKEERETKRKAFEDYIDLIDNKD